jgi:hypothetical protein
VRSGIFTGEFQLSNKGSDKSLLIEEILFYMDSVDRELVKLGLRDGKTKVQRSFERTRVTLSKMDVAVLLRIKISAKIYLEMLADHPENNKKAGS